MCSTPLFKRIFSEQNCYTFQAYIFSSNTLLNIPNHERDPTTTPVILKLHSGAGNSSVGTSLFVILTKYFASIADFRQLQIIKRANEI